MLQPPRIPRSSTNIKRPCSPFAASGPSSGRQAARVQNLFTSFFRKTKIKLYCPPLIYALEHALKKERSNRKNSKNDKSTSNSSGIPIHTVLEPQLRSSLSPSKHCSPYSYPFI
ncbi:hypothetical protein AXF42_Ash016762 [Apostasia shenzhenica]|uniref:Uncharacterized protein n=1 Tax=Apostasia shenzhenica TaxID=1088818 RepID=A0A2I0AQG6_9ASPA|nr:hypothetical protein AXF42_Ash016762 [Apostasia shenzhenica]